MSLRPLDLQAVMLVPGRLMMTQKTDMIIFHLTQWDLKTESDYLFHGVRMSVTMRRKVTSELMTTYFPCLLLIAITYATTFFKPFFFEAALSVNLTTMLVMTTIFISKMEGLPPTSDIKMIDIWLILCQLVPFTQVVLLTAMECLREDEIEEGVKENETEVEHKKRGGEEETEVTVFKEDQEVHTKEAWEISKQKKSYVAILMVIGKIINRIDTEAYITIPQKRECCPCQYF